MLCSWGVPWPLALCCRHLSADRGRKPANKRKKQVCRGKGEMRDMSQDEVLERKSFI